MSGPHLLPVWLRWIWVAIYFLVTLTHARHALVSTGRRRGWHAGHTAMAAGMGYMYLPRMFKPVPNLAGAIVFGLITTYILIWLLRTWSHGSAANALWLLLLFDIGSMAYMFILPTIGLGWLSYSLILYFVLESAGWALGSFDEAKQHKRVVIGPAVIQTKRQTTSLASQTSPGIRFSLSAMSLGMAYMFLIMQIQR